MSNLERRTLARLRADTALLHRRVESDLDLFGPRPSWLDYRLYLFRMYGFHAPLEAALGGLVRALVDVVPDAALRTNKLALLAQDLVALGVDRRDLGQLPRIAITGFDDVAEALGWMYVLEALTVDGSRLAAHLGAHLPLEIETASAYLRCYGSQVVPRWDAFADQVEQFAAADPARVERVVAAACEGFARLHRWLRPSVPARAASAAVRRVSG